MLHLSNLIAQDMTILMHWMPHKYSRLNYLLLYDLMHLNLIIKSLSSHSIDILKKKILKALHSDININKFIIFIYFFIKRLKGNKWKAEKRDGEITSKYFQSNNPLSYFSSSLINFFISFFHMHKILAWFCWVIGFRLSWDAFGDF